MYICRHCGFVSQESNINYCNNEKCKYFGHASFIDSRNIASSEESFKNQTEYIKENQALDFLPPETRMFIPQYLNSKNNDEIINSQKQNKMPQSLQNNAECILPKDNQMLGLATVPFQKFEKIYSYDKALSKGTIFEGLDMPYDKKIFKRG